LIVKITAEEAGPFAPAAKAYHQATTPLLDELTRLLDKHAIFASSVKSLNLANRVNLVNSAEATKGANVPSKQNAPTEAKVALPREETAENPITLMKTAASVATVNLKS
jgi:hypothetical protein